MSQKCLATISVGDVILRGHTVSVGTPMSSLRRVPIRTHRSLQGKMPQVGNAETLAGQIAASQLNTDTPSPVNVQDKQELWAHTSTQLPSQESWPQTLTLVILLQLLKTAPRALKPEQKRGLDRSLPVASITLFKTINLASLCKTRSSIWENEISAVTDGSYPHFPTRSSKKRHMASSVQAPRLVILVTSSESYRRAENQARKSTALWGLGLWGGGSPRGKEPACWGARPRPSHYQLVITTSTGQMELFATLYFPFNNKTGRK